MSKTNKGHIQDNQNLQRSPMTEGERGEITLIIITLFGNCKFEEKKNISNKPSQCRTLPIERVIFSGTISPLAEHCLLSG